MPLSEPRGGGGGANGLDFGSFKMLFTMFPQRDVNTGGGQPFFQVMHHTTDNRFVFHSQNGRVLYKDPNPSVITSFANTLIGNDTPADIKENFIDGGVLVQQGSTNGYQRNPTSDGSSPWVQINTGLGFSQGPIFSLKGDGNLYGSRSGAGASRELIEVSGDNGATWSAPGDLWGWGGKGCERVHVSPDGTTALAISVASGSSSCAVVTANNVLGGGLNVGTLPVFSAYNKGALNTDGTVAVIIPDSAASRIVIVQGLKGTLSFTSITTPANILQANVNDVCYDATLGGWILVASNNNVIFLDETDFSQQQLPVFRVLSSGGICGNGGGLASLQTGEILGTCGTTGGNAPNIFFSLV